MVTNCIVINTVTIGANFSRQILTTVAAVSAAESEAKVTSGAQS